METNIKNTKLPHMGDFIKNKIQQSPYTKAELSRKMNISQPTMNSYFFQETLQTRTIWKLSQALQYNLFTDLSNMLPQELQETNRTSFQDTILAQQQEIADLKKEIAIYKEILSKKV